MLSDFDFIARFLREHSGYQLSRDNEHVFLSRLEGILLAAGCVDSAALVVALAAAPSGKEAAALLQAMTINETMFFRDETPFKNIKDHILPTLTAGEAPRTLTFWCAACSSGQEPYSLAMTLDSVKDHYPGWRFDILATDLSEEMIERGKQGVYSDFETGRGLPAEMRERYFRQESGQWRIADSLRAMVRFQPLNLLRMPADIGPFDVILCRNVLIYFDEKQKTGILSALRRMSRHPGYLMTGSAEVLSYLTEEYGAHPEWKGVYVTR